MFHHRTHHPSPKKESLQRVNSVFPMFNIWKKQQRNRKNLHKTLVRQLKKVWKKLLNSYSNSFEQPRNHQRNLLVLILEFIDNNLEKELPSKSKRDKEEITSAVVESSESDDGESINSINSTVVIASLEIKENEKKVRGIRRCVLIHLENIWNS